MQFSEVAKCKEAEGRRQKAERRRQETEGRRQEAEGRRQKAEDRRQKAEGRRQKERKLLTFFKCILFSPPCIKFKLKYSQATN
jgi:hypothetical protein